MIFNPITPLGLRNSWSSPKYNFTPDLSMIGLGKTSSANSLFGTDAFFGINGFCSATIKSSYIIGVLSSL